jgi:hypothetical protein
MDASGLAPRKRLVARTHAMSLGFQRDDESDLLPGILVELDPNASGGRIVEECRVWTVDELAQAIIAIEKTART